MTKIGVHRICGIGDAVQITPLLRQIRMDRPDAEITCLVSDNAADVLGGSPWIDRLVPLAKRSVTPGRWNPLLLQMWQKVAREGPFDLFLHLGPRWLHAVGAFLVPAQRRAGLATNSKWRPQPFETTLSFPTNPLEETRHASQVYLDLWTATTGFQDRGFCASLPQLGQRKVAADLGITGPFICMAPGAGNWLNPATNKRWPARHWQRLMEMAIQEGLRVAVIGTPGDISDQHLPKGVHSLLGKISLDETASVLRESLGFVGHDSGLFHLALGLGVPAAAFFGPTREDLTGPFRNPRSLVIKTNLPCVPCCNQNCQLAGAEALSMEGRPPCMHLMSPQSVWSLLHPFFKKPAVATSPIMVLKASL